MEVKIGPVDCLPTECRVIFDVTYDTGQTESIAGWVKNADARGKSKTAITDLAYTDALPLIESRRAQLDAEAAVEKVAVETDLSTLKGRTYNPATKKLGPEPVKAEAEPEAVQP